MVAPAVARLAEAAQQSRPVADDAWLGGSAEPGTASPTSGRPARGGRVRPNLPAPYVPTPVPLLGGSRYPLILVEGGEYAGKTTQAFELAELAEPGALADGAVPIVSQTYVIAVGEDVDEFREIAPSALKLPHDGTWHQIIGCVDWVAARAREAVDAGHPPVLLIIDSMTKIWDLLSQWAENRARTADSNRTRLALDPNAAVDVHPSYWTPANRRHDQLVAKLTTMPAIVVVTARAGMVTVIDERTGNPTKEREYRVRMQKDLGYATQAWVRVSQNEYPQIVGLRRVRGGIRPRKDDPLFVDPRTDRFKGVKFSLEWLLRHVLKFDAATARVASTVAPVADADAPVSAPPAPGPVDADEPAGAGPSNADVTPAGS